MEDLKSVFINANTLYQIVQKTKQINIFCDNNTRTILDQVF